MTNDRFILACQTYFVNQRTNGTPQKKRMHHATLDEFAISPRLKALGRHIVHCQSKQEPVRVPALNGAEWGQLLRTLEHKRAYI
ncbi:MULTISPECIES: hypothetical protein [Yersinia]|uniref:Uncharacterized protein n=3 Tax=Yersinia TaxID=629 RepID=B7UF28_YERPU|nr:MULTISPECIES: hypothetical protein [Yersinia]AHK22078.1 hypothetical protein BF17_00170 [Yersinia similis]MBO1551401.1 hypothetical protein [Yersinia pseudotuberculosis]MBO1562477.1 hypothetical protein [Yersinia pseudotuberculosis]MBO1571454.1 hypothetical protein [Yersinia pseudotuberculosis]MBO1586406.1 hypothetical protein [Yersinia pseudotuberculosis]